MKSSHGLKHFISWKSKRKLPLQEGGLEKRDWEDGLGDESTSSVYSKTSDTGKQRCLWPLWGYWV